MFIEELYLGIVLAVYFFGSNSAVTVSDHVHALCAQNAAYICYQTVLYRVIEEIDQYVWMRQYGSL